MAFVLFTGIEALDGLLRRLGESAKPVSRKALKAGATVLVKAAQLKAPVGKPTKARQRSQAAALNRKRGKRAMLRLKQSVGISNVKENRVIVSLKVTVAAYHGHFVTLGVTNRQKGRKGRHALTNRDTRTEKGGSLEDTDRVKIGGLFAWRGAGHDSRNKGTGTQRPRPFFREAYTAVKAEMERVRHDTLADEVIKEWQKR